MRWPPPPDWPMAACSRQVLHRPHRWHVQEAGTGNTLLLIHGAGGATQSFRTLFPRLAETHHVVAVDLPGQGFTQSGAQARYGLMPTATDLMSLARLEGWKPTQIIGHSAGAAIALAMSDLGFRPTRRIVGINAALSNFKGVAGIMFPFLAKALAMTPLSASLFSATASTSSVTRLIAGTGSRLDAAGVALYLRLTRDKGHVDGTLSMMAQWRLDELLARLPRIQTETLFIVGEDDQAVPPDTSVKAAKILPNAGLVRLPGLGHLAHEEDPDTIARLIRA